MLSNQVAEAFAALDAAVQTVGALDWDALPAGERLEALDRLEIATRRQRASSHSITSSLDRNDNGEIGRILPRVIADVLRLSLSESRRRLRDARQLSARTTLTGQTLPPQLPATAKAWEAGQLDPEHLRSIQKFFRDLPADLPPSRSGGRRKVPRRESSRTAPRPVGEGRRQAGAAAESGRQIQR